MGDCQNYGPFRGTLNIRCRINSRDPKKDHNFDNHPYEEDPHWGNIRGYIGRGLGVRDTGLRA